MKKISSYLRKIAADSARMSDQDYWSSKLKDTFDLEPHLDSGVTEGYWILRQIYTLFQFIPPQLIKACGIKKLLIRSDMGPNKPYYPNHGYFIDDKVALNADIFIHPDLPDDFFDHRGYFLTRPQQTIYHEFGHGFDAYHGDLSLKTDWLKLSGWSETPAKGLQKLVIKEKGVPPVIGEWYFNPSAGFTRFYAKRNPWDDWADSFSFYVAGMVDKIPENKQDYFKGLLKKYY